MQTTTLNIDFPDLHTSVKMTYATNENNPDDGIHYSFVATYGTYVINIMFQKFHNLISKFIITDSNSHTIDSKVLMAIVNSAFSVAEEDWNERNIEVAC